MLGWVGAGMEVVVGKHAARMDWLYVGYVGAGMEVVVGKHAARRDWLYVGMGGGRHGGCGW